MCEYSLNIKATKNRERNDNYPIGTTIVSTLSYRVVYIKVDNKNWALIDVPSKTIYIEDVFAEGKVRQSIWDGTDESFEIRVP